MSFESSVRDEITTLIDATWTDLTVIYREEPAARINWREMLELFDRGSEDGVNCPFCVVEFGQLAASGDWGDANDAYEMPVSIFYISRRSDPGGVPITQTDFENVLIDRADAMRKALESRSTANFQVVKSSSDRSAAIPPNSYFLKNKIPLYAVMVTATLVCGEESA